MSDISKLVIEGAGQQFKGKDFNELCGPGVYVFIGKGRPLYIGMGQNALARCSQQRHRKAYVRMEADEIRIFPCVSVEAAKDLELHLISRLQPIFNSQNKSWLLKKRLGLDRATPMIPSSVMREMPPMCVTVDTLSRAENIATA